MEIKDNTFLRQFETTVDGKLIAVEYSLQEKKLFLTRILNPDSAADESTIEQLLRAVLNLATERKLKVVPVFPKIAAFFRKNPVYKELLPPGIKI